MYVCESLCTFTFFSYSQSLEETILLPAQT